MERNYWTRTIQRWAYENNTSTSKGRKVEDLTTLDGARAWIERHRSVLSGSRARGDWHEDSDWEYNLAYRDVKILGRELRRQGIEFDSCITGHISWEPDGVRVEVYDCFPTRYPFKDAGYDQRKGL